jgi:hypothetical protein
MQDDMNPIEYTTREKAMFAALPRESDVNQLEEQRLVNALRSEGYFKRPQRGVNWKVQIAAALLLFVAGGGIGVRYGMSYASRNSIETQIARKDLTLTERVLVLQHAGSLYVNAANAYADATAVVDSTAIEVAREILKGAATAVARRSMDGGMSARLAIMLSGSD